MNEDLSEDEKILFAKCFASTPSERWLMNQSFLKGLDVYTQASRKKRGVKLEWPDFEARLKLTYPNGVKGKPASEIIDEGRDE